MTKIKEVTVFAPGSVGNVAVGFDVLGFSLLHSGDTVTVRQIDTAEVRVVKVNNPRIPLETKKNTAAVALQSLCQDLQLKTGFEIEIQKGIPLSSGMGGSAASAVGAAYAANIILGNVLSPLQVLKYSLLGEKVASGSMHGDNVAPSLFGGLVGVLSNHPLEVFQIPIPPSIHCLLVHPEMEIETAKSRAGLRKDVLLAEHAMQSAHLAAFISACHSGNLDLMSKSMLDLIIEPQREKTIPNFRRAKQAALRAGALGFSISGSGPSIFGWFKNKSDAEKAQRDLMIIFDEVGLEQQSWVFPLPAPGARVISSKGLG